MESTRKIQGRFSLRRKCAATQFRSKISQCSPSGFILGPCTDARQVLDPTTQIEEAEGTRWCGHSWVNKHAKFRLLSVQPKTELELYKLASVTRSRPFAFDRYRASHPKSSMNRLK